MYIGYGVRISTTKWKEDAYSILLNEVKENTPEIYDQYLLYAEDNEMDASNPKSFEMFGNEYQDDWNNEGIPALLKDYIIEQEVQFARWLSCDYAALFVYLYIPTNLDDVITIPKIESVLAKYLSPLFQEPVVVDWLEVDNDD